MIPVGGERRTGSTVIHQYQYLDPSTMKKKLLFTTIACLSVFLHINAFRLQYSFTEDIKPERTIERTDSSITVSYTFHGGVIRHDTFYPESVHLDIPEFGHNGALEEPEYPYRCDSFEIPFDYEVRLSLVTADWCDLNIILGPCYPLLEDRPGAPSFSRKTVPPVKEFDGVLPEKPVTISGFTTYRDRPILYVDVMPVKCIGNKKTMACDKLVYRIDFTPSEKKRDPNKIIHDVDDEFMASMFTSTIYGDKKAGRYNSDKSKKKKASNPTPSEKKVSKSTTRKSKFPIPNRNQRKHKSSPTKSSTNKAQSPNNN